jgi:hypothetical protein
MEKLKELEARRFNDDGNCSAIFPEERDLTTRKNILGILPRQMDAFTPR